MGVEFHAVMFAAGRIGDQAAWSQRGDRVALQGASIRRSCQRPVMLAPPVIGTGSRTSRMKSIA